MPTEIDYARLAAFIDGEGSMFLLHSKTVSRKAITINLHVTNTDIRLMEWLKSTFGVGSIHVSRHGSGNRQTAYRWKCQARMAVDLIEAAYPYFVIKREQADVVRAFRNLQKRPGTNLVRTGGGQTEPENYAQRLHLVEDMKRLNKRGIA
jgi:hypothetical protein